MSQDYRFVLPENQKSQYYDIRIDCNFIDSSARPFKISFSYGLNENSCYFVPFVYFVVKSEFLIWG